jgi:ABC-type polysaccharide/polyol phosphate export permease
VRALSAPIWAWRFDLALTFLERAIRLRNKRSLLANYWPLILPVFLTALWVFVGRGVFAVDIPHYPVFLFAGVTAWAFLSTTILRAMMTLSAEHALIHRGRFAYEMLPLSHVGSTAVFLFALLGGIILYSAAYGWLEPGLLPLLALPVAALLLLVGAISLVLAILDVHLRDVRQVIPSLLTVWFFATPIVYRPSMLPDWARSWIELNPMTPIVVNVRAILVEGTAGDTLKMSILLVLCAALFAACLIGFRRAARDVSRTV